MNPTDKKEFKGLMLRIGIVLIAQNLLIQTLGAVPTLLKSLYGFWLFEDDVIHECADMLTYLFSFMFPVALFAMISGKHPREPMRLAPAFGRDTLKLLLAGLAVLTAAAWVNGVLTDWIDFSILYTTEKYDTPAAVILQFMSLAIVPAVCEEFLFRGCILSNMLPYGRSFAVIGSAVLFGAMHANYGQFLYAFCGGIFLALIYIESGSVVPGMFFHLINNMQSVIAGYIKDNHSYAVYNSFLYVLDICVLLAGTLSAVLFIRSERNSGGFSRLNGARPTRDIIYNDSNMTSGVTGERISCFFSPTVIIFLAVSVSEALLIIAETFIYAAYQ